MKVCVGLSGGVDSAVSAARLVEAGHEVIGVFIKVWHPDFLVCNWEAERLDAMRVAAHLGIPFLTCDAEATYRDSVAKYFIDEYRAGRTPNPDVLCNREVKFGTFLEFARKHGADLIATGHYARRLAGHHGPELHRAVDTAKDQSYFLWSLTPDQLQSTLFPIGDTPKAAVRGEAAQRGLPVATKRDSQGICFLGHVDIKEFLSHYLSLVPGPVLTENGEVIGTHDGAVVYTIGQRHGFTITKSSSREPHYVIWKDIQKNILVVSTDPPKEQPHTLLTLQNIQLRDSITVGDTLIIQTRYRGTPMLAEVATVDTTTISLQPHTAFDRPASGQSCVLYRDSHCVGGGMIV